MKKLLMIFLMIFCMAGIAGAEDFGVPGDTYNEMIDNTVSWVINGDQNTIINVDAGNDAIIGGVGLDDIDKPEQEIDPEDFPQRGCLYWAEGSPWVYALEFINSTDSVVHGKLYIAGSMHDVYVQPRDSETLTISARDKRLGIPERVKVGALWSIEPSVVEMKQVADK